MKGTNITLLLSLHRVTPAQLLCRELQFCSSNRNKAVFPFHADWVHNSTAEDQWGSRQLEVMAYSSNIPPLLMVGNPFKLQRAVSIFLEICIYSHTITTDYP